MRLNIRHLFIALVVVCLSSTVPAQNRRSAGRRIQSASSLQEKVIDVGGHKMWFKVAGTGAPTVVLDYGLGANAGSWDNIFPEVARFTRVVAYDRPGYGKSEPGSEPRSQTQIARDLHALLQSAGILPPYVLVGHSLGGANVRAFAHLFKDEIAGLVFIDPFNETVFTSAAKEQQEAAVTQQTEALRDAPAAAQSEFKYLGDEVRKGFPEMKSFGVPPDVPMMVIVAGTDRPPRWVESVMSLYGPWAAAAKEGRLLLLPDSSHFVQGDEPGIVIESIRRVVFPSVRNRLEQTIKTQGVPAAVALYREMRSRYPAEYFRERTLNVLGYQQLNNKHVAEAIELFKLNVEMYPRASNPYDSLGEAYMVHGDRALAIKNYRLSLKLNPKNTGAIDALRKLQSAP